MAVGVVPGKGDTTGWGPMMSDVASFVKADESIDCAGEPDHDGLCLLEQKLFLDAIQNDRDLSDHMSDAVNSLRIVLAADEAFRAGRTVDLSQRVPATTSRSTSPCLRCGLG